MSMKRLITLLAAVACAVAMLPAGAAGDELELKAALKGQPIPLSDVAKFHCHDGLYPLITCFETEAEMVEDAESMEMSTSSTSSSWYVHMFEHASYGGASIYIQNPEPDLHIMGWGNVVSSFKSLNNQRPKYWDYTNYSGTAWRWPAGAQISYVGDGANDRFSSMQNVP
jgi:hypothetical protein